MPPVQRPSVLPSPETKSPALRLVGEEPWAWRVREEPGFYNEVFLPAPTCWQSFFWNPHLCPEPISLSAPATLRVPTHLHIFFANQNVSPSITGTVSSGDLAGDWHTVGMQWLLEVVMFPGGSGRLYMGQKSWTPFYFSCLPSFLPLPMLARNLLVQTGCRVKGGVAPASCPLSLWKLGGRDTERESL